MIVQGGLDAFNAMRGGFPSQNSIQQLQQQFQSSMSYLNEAQQSIVQNAQAAYRLMTQNESANLLRNLGTKIANVWSSGIQQLYSIDELQTADTIMQRWVMAHPGVRAMYLDNRCEGYGDAYENVQGEAIGRGQYDYRQVMNGVMIAPEEGDAYTEFYHDSRSSNDIVLSVSEQVDILSTWGLIDRLLEEQDEDPTSPYGADLG